MEFPPCLFPGGHTEGPIAQQGPRSGVAPGWGGHGGVQEAELRQTRFVPLYSRSAEHWDPTEPAPLPLLPPNADGGLSVVTEADLVHSKRRSHRHTNPSTAGVTFRFSQQMGGLCWDDAGLAFQCMGRLLEPHCFLGAKYLKGPHQADTQRMTQVLHRLRNTPHQECPYIGMDLRVRSLSHLTADWLSDVPPALLAELLNEGMAADWRRLQFQESHTGGALCWAPHPDPSTGCLIYPQGAAINQLCFQQMLLGKSGVKTHGEAAVCELQQAIRQVSTAQLHSTFVGVRTMYNVASFSLSADFPPRALGVVATRSPASCVTVSPHIPGQLCVCTEGGALYLWHLESGLQRVRLDEETLFFRDDPRWRWGDFTSHPRVLLYADRTGVQAADTRVGEATGLDLFRIGQESSCRTGERVILARNLRETDPAHFLVTTQFSAYIMDERFPVVPAVKWAHLLQGPPTFVSVIPGGGADRTNKMLLGAEHSQETVMLQYSGGDTRAIQLHLPPTKLPLTTDALHHLQPLLPHHHDNVTQRLASPMSGLAAAYSTHTPEWMTVFQLTEAGDVFTHRLRHRKPPEANSDPEVRPSWDNPDSNAEAAGTPVARPPGETPESPHDNPSRRSPSPESVSTSQTPLADPVDEAAVEGRPGTFTPKARLSITKWIRRLMKVCGRSAGGPQHPGIGISKLFSVAEVGEAAKEVDELRDRLRQSMRTGGLVKINVPPVPVLELACTKAWRDPLSQRLSASWEGQLGPWWDDYFGLNKSSKIRALREKRRQQRLRRVSSQSSLSSFASSFSMDSDHYESEATSPRSVDTNLSSYTAFSETQASLFSEPESVWSFMSGPCLRPELTSSELPSRNMSAAKNSEISSNIASLQDLRCKGIPRERQRTLQDFITFLGEDRGPAASSQISSQDLQTFSQQTQPSTQGLQTSEERFQASTQDLQTLSWHTERSSQSLQPFSQQSQSFSQSLQTPSQASQLRASSPSLQTTAQTPTQGSRQRTSSQGSQRRTPSQGSQLRTSLQCSQLQTSSQGSQRRTPLQGSQLRTPSQGFQLGASSQSSQALSQVFQASTRSQTPQPHASSQSLQPQPSQQSQTQASSQSSHSEAQTHSQRKPPAKKFRMGF